MCECCEVNAAQPDSFFCKDCEDALRIPLDGEKEDESIEE